MVTARYAGNGACLPQRTRAMYDVVRDNLQTLYEAVEDGFVSLQRQSQSPPCSFYLRAATLGAERDPSERKAANQSRRCCGESSGSCRNGFADAVRFVARKRQDPLVSFTYAPAAETR